MKPLHNSSHARVKDLLTGKIISSGAEQPLIVLAKGIDLIAGGPRFVLRCGPDTSARVNGIVVHEKILVVGDEVDAGGRRVRIMAPRRSIARQILFAAAAGVLFLAGLALRNSTLSHRELPAMEGAESVLVQMTGPIPKTESVPAPQESAPPKDPALPHPGQLKIRKQMLLAELMLSERRIRKDNLPAAIAIWQRVSALTPGSEEEKFLKELAAGRLEQAKRLFSEEIQATDAATRFAMRRNKKAGQGSMMKRHREVQSKAPARPSITKTLSPLQQNQP